jgi:hypothetical protein
VKTKFLVVYDYGTGGLWAVISAASPAEIIEKYPALTVLEKQPDWMTKEYYLDIASKSTFDIDDEPPRWLKLTLTEKS